MELRIDVSKEKITEFCRKNHVKRLAFFGSVLRDDFGPNSNVDVLVEFESGAKVGFIKLAESATFGQALSAARNDALTAEYGRSIRLRLLISLLPRRRQGRQWPAHRLSRTPRHAPCWSLPP